MLLTGGMAKYWIIPRVGDKELPRVGHQLINSYVLMFLTRMITIKKISRCISTFMYVCIQVCMYVCYVCSFVCLFVCLLVFCLYV